MTVDISLIPVFEELPSMHSKFFFFLKKRKKKKSTSLTEAPASQSKTPPPSLPLSPLAGGISYCPARAGGENRMGGFLSMCVGRVVRTRRKIRGARSCCTAFRNGLCVLETGRSCRVQPPPTPLHVKSLVSQGERISARSSIRCLIIHPTFTFRCRSVENTRSHSRPPSTLPPLTLYFISRLENIDR